VPGGAGGAPAPSGGGGPSAPCSANCKVNPNLPVQLPATATISGGVVIVAVGCLDTCTGKLTITGTLGGHHHVNLALVSKHGAHATRAAVLGKRSFSLPAKKPTKLRVQLNKAARKGLKSVKSFKATLTVELKLGKAKPARYTQPIELVGPGASKPPKAK
jgi:hypothetical protein